jgi:hypothetical protein
VRLSGSTGGTLFFFVLAAAIVAGAYLGSSVAADATAPGLNRVQLQDPAQFTDVPAWAGRSDAGFTGFGGLPALPGLVFRSGVVGALGEGVLVIDSADAQTTIDYTDPLRLFQIRTATSPLAVGDSVLVRVVDGKAVGFLRLLVNIEAIEGLEEEAPSDETEDEDDD